MRIRPLAVTTALVIGGAALPNRTSAQAIGTLIGTNISTISDTEQGVSEVAGAALNKKKRIGLKAGFYLRIPLAGMFSLEPELLYTQNGVTYEATSPISETFAVDLGYVEVPVLLRVDLMPKAKLHPFLMAGGSGARRVQCKFDQASGASTVKEDCNANGEDEDPLKKMDYSAIGAAGIAGQLGGISASLQLRVTQGLTTISNDELETSKPKNRALSVLLGFKF